MDCEQAKTHVRSGCNISACDEELLYDRGVAIHRRTGKHCLATLASSVYGDRL